LKEILPAIWVFQGVHRLSFFQIGIFGELKEQMYLSKENHFCQKQENLSQCFPVGMELVFEKNTSCKSEFERWRMALFVPNRPVQLN
jgi:hypothetical protein